MRITSSTTRLNFTLPLALVLVACGDDGNTSNASAEADPIAKYIGTYVSTCYKNAEVTSATTGAELYEVDTLVVGPALGTLKADVTIMMNFYSTSACPGFPIDTVVASGSNTFLSLAGRETVSGQQVEKIQFGQDPLFPGMSSGTSLTVNGVKFADVKYTQQTPSVLKEIWRLDANNDLFIGDTTKPLDSTGYPTVMQTGLTAKKH